MFHDRKKLAAFRRADRAVLTELYRAHIDDISRLARHGFRFESGGATQRFRGYPDPSEQQNLIQETFVRAFGERARASYDGLSPYGAYLAAIARNVVIDSFRRKSTSLLVFDVDIVNAAPNEAAPASAADIDRPKLIDVVSRFTSELPVREARFVELRYQRALTQEEAGQQMGVGRSTARTLERRVREKLRLRLEREGLIARDERRPGLAALSVFA